LAENSSQEKTCDADQTAAKQTTNPFSMKRRLTDQIHQLLNE
jgi:hypothetical protein